MYVLGNYVYKLLSHVNEFNTSSCRNVTYYTKGSERRYLEEPWVLSNHLEHNILVGGANIHNGISVKVLSRKKNSHP